MNREQILGMLYKLMEINFNSIIERFYDITDFI